jgi:hypothetical protein
MKRRFFICTAVILFCAGSVFAQKNRTDETANALPLVGAYDVTFSFSTVEQRRLTVLLYSGGTGSFRLSGRTTTTPVNTATPAVYDWITQDIISFSGEVRFPIGNVGQDTGTLLFKGQRTLNGEIAGRAIFVTNRPDAENPTGFVTRSGPFTAVPLPIVAAK